jgi:hypothetical protein
MTFRAKCLLTVALSAGVLVAGEPTAKADQIIYWTNFGGRQIEKTDVTLSNTTTVVDNVPAGASGNPDSLIFGPTGNILYTMYNGSPGTVRSFNTDNTDTLVASPLSPFGSQLVDITLDTSNTTVLVSDRGANSLDRVVISSGVTTVLNTLLSGLNGTAYDASGNLYAVANGTIVQLNPINGAVIRTGTAPTNDGLTWDPVTGHLFASNGACMEEISTVTLAAISCLGSFSFIDGLESDGLGHIIIADSAAAQVDQWTISGGIKTVLFSAPGLDDIAPLVGGGAPPPPPVPEPSSLAVLGAALAGLRFVRRRRQR